MGTITHHDHASVGNQTGELSFVTYIHAQIIKVIESSDRKARVEVLKRNDGLFEFRASVECYEDGYYWAPTLNSGLYASVEEAERDALHEVLALDAKSKPGH
jgi:hypothetical protein